ncbi:hypothetical protein AMS68_003584 [Peltaster fructicola]|uniref:DASH complex subunit DAD2 n=1 Tax=Peltaster fructicola TaxID=286661 RepID=A0A6H0XTH2_9PEZI|nr:hypothetical protein AMS68_003584 [Peltaster fructicola]
MHSRQTILPSQFRPSSGLGLSAANTSQSTALAARVAEKKAELESLQQLRDLSGGLVDQMQQLEQKLSTLNNGTEAVAEVMSNWGTVLRAIATASAGVSNVVAAEDTKILPQTLVRIPIEQAEEAKRKHEREHVSDD